MNNESERVTLSIEGMGCGGCAAKIESRLKQVAGVGAAAVSFDQAEATVEYDPAQTDRIALVALLAEDGYAIAVSSASPNAAG